MENPAEEDTQASPEKTDETTLTSEAVAVGRVEIADDDLPEDFEREVEARDDSALIDRFVAALTTPRVLFSSLSPSTGWFGAIALVLCASLFQALIQINMTDLDKYFEVQQQKAFQKMPDWQRRAYDKKPESERRQAQRLSLFFLKMGLFVSPWIMAFVSLVFFGLFLLFLSWLCRGRRSFALALVISAHAQLIDVMRSLSLAVVAAATGLAQPRSNLSGLVEEGSDPVLSALLGWADPFTLFFFALLGFGLVQGMQVKRPRLAIFLLALFVIFAVLVTVGMTAGLAMLQDKAGEMVKKG